MSSPFPSSSIELKFSRRKFARKDALYVVLYTSAIGDLIESGDDLVSVTPPKGPMPVDTPSFRWQFWPYYMLAARASGFALDDK